MCIQCMMGAMSAGASATGARSYLATRKWAWLTDARLKQLTILLIVVGLVAASTLLSGSTPRPS